MLGIDKVSKIMSGNYFVLHTSSGDFAVVDDCGRVLLSDLSITGLAARLKMEQSDGRLKDGSIVTGEPVIRDDSSIHGLTSEEHRVFWKLYSSKSYI